VYWPYIVKKFAESSEVVSTEESMMLLYLAQHFANAGNMLERFPTIFSSFQE